MTEVIENTDIDLTILINWEEEVSCEIEDCGNEVKWKITNWCGCFYLTCQMHYEITVTNKHLHGIWSCRKCRLTTTGTYGDLITVEPV